MGVRSILAPARPPRPGWRLLGAPWPVPAYTVTHVPSFIVQNASEDALAEIVTSLAVLVLLLVFLWRGSRVAWTVLALFEVFAVVIQPFDPSAWWAFALNALGLVLLLTPACRAHVWGVARPTSG